MNDALRAVVGEHAPALKSAGLITDRVPVVMMSMDGTILEVFEWKSPEAIAQAHADPVVQVLWEKFAGVCEFVPVGKVPEAAAMFSEFEPVNVYSAAAPAPKAARPRRRKKAAARSAPKRKAAAKKRPLKSRGRSRRR